MCCNMFGKKGNGLDQNLEVESSCMIHNVMLYNAQVKIVTASSKDLEAVKRKLETIFAQLVS